jgi:dTMP kinase
VAQVIAPGLAAGSVVVTDRYFLSSVAYQGARGLDWRGILEESEEQFPIPDLALLFRIDPAAGLERIRGRGHRAEPAFEERRFLLRVAAIYEAVERPWLQRIPAQRSAEIVLADALVRVRAALGR